MPRVVREVAVAGVYQTKQGDLSDRMQAEVWFECAKGACEDAGISLRDVDGLVYDGPQGAGIREKLPGAALGYDLLGKPLRYHASSSIGAAMTSAGLRHPRSVPPASRPHTATWCPSIRTPLTRKRRGSSRSSWGVPKPRRSQPKARRRSPARERLRANPRSRDTQEVCLSLPQAVQK